MNNRYFNHQKFQQNLRSYGQYGFILAGLMVGCIVLGFVLQFPWLINGLLGLKILKLNTALCLFLLSLSGWLQSQSFPSRRSLINLCNTIVLSLSITTLIQYIFQLDLGIDQLYLSLEPVKEIDQTTISPGRMAVFSAINFSLLGLAQILFNQRHPQYFKLQILAISSFLIALLSFCSYLYGNAEFYHNQPYPNIALYVSINFLILSLSNLFIYPDQGLMKIFTSNTAGGAIARILLPLTIILSPLLCGLILIGYRQEFYTVAMGFNLLGMIYIIIFGAIIWQTAYFLDQIDRQRQDAEDSLHLQQEELQEQNQSLETINQQLLQEILQRQEAELSIAIQQEELQEQNHSLEIINRQLQQEINKRQQIEKVLRESSEQYLAILEDQSELICRFQPDGKLLFVNKAYCNYYGKTKEELIGNTYEPVIFPEDIDKINQMLDSLGLEHPLATIEHRAIVKGEIRWMQWTNRAIFDEQGNFIEFQSVGRDIHDRKQAEMELQKTNQQLQSLLDNSPALISLFDVKGRYLRVNKTFAQFLNLSSPEQVIGKSFDDFLPESKVANFKARISQLIETHQPLNVEDEITINDQIKTFQSILFPVLDNSNISTIFWGISFDITQQKQIETALKVKTEELDKFFSVSLDLLSICDYEGYFTRVNSQWEETLGYRVEEIEGTKFFDYIHPEDLEKTHAAMKILTDQQQKVTNFANRYRCRDGSYRWIEWRSVPVGNLIYGAARDITDRIKTEEALKESEARFRAFFEQAAVGVTLCDHQGKFIEFNQRFCEIVGYAASELKELSFRDITHPEDAENDWQSVQEMWAGKIQTFSREKRYIRADGQVQWADLTASLVRNNEGITEYSLAIIIDINDRIKAEAARRENEELFRTIFEKGPLGMAIIGLDYRFLKVNIMLCQMLGYLEEELSQLTFADITHPDDLDQDLELAEKLYRGDIPYYKLQKRYLTKNNESKWIMLTGSVIRDQQGNPLYYLAMIEDISNIYQELCLRQQAESILRKYERIVAATVDGISLIDRNYIYQAVNQAYLHWHQKSYPEIIGHSVSEVLGKDPFEKIIKPRLDQCFTGETVQYEMWYDYPMMKHQFLSVTYAPSIEEDQTISGAVVSIRNITELKQKQEIEASLQEKEVLLKEIHHRVKNNLQVIHSLLNLQARSIQDPLIRDLFKESQNRVQSMALIHEHLYRSDDFSQIDLSQYLHELVNILCASYKVKNSVINVTIDIQENFLLDIDTAVPCGLIINELVSNAIKYAFDPDQKGTIYLGVKSDDQQNLVLTIADNGKGLPVDLDWEQSPTLGLKLVNNLTNQLRGTITIQIDQGTKFTLVISRIKVKKDS